MPTNREVQRCGLHTLRLLGGYAIRTSEQSAATQAQAGYTRSQELHADQNPGGGGRQVEVAEDKSTPVDKGDDQVPSRTSEAQCARGNSSQGWDRAPRLRSAEDPLALRQHHEASRVLRRADPSKQEKALPGDSVEPAGIESLFGWSESHNDKVGTEQTPEAATMPRRGKKEKKEPAQTRMRTSA